MRRRRRKEEKEKKKERKRESAKEEEGGEGGEGRKGGKGGGGVGGGGDGEGGEGRERVERVHSDVGVPRSLDIRGAAAQTLLMDVRRVNRPNQKRTDERGGSLLFLAAAAAVIVLVVIFRHFFFFLYFSYSRIDSLKFLPKGSLPRDTFRATRDTKNKRYPSTTDMPWQTQTASRSDLNLSE
ncbi:hypothetical protein V1478_015861 [Vespula squamosa]|uniref:Uncharacterized protein n=1 Tax=Vespula squamosa TaxID=30214 RepID=A0ABD2A217_VESSQ